LKYFKFLNPLLERLHDVGTQRDTAGNRQLFFDQYASRPLFLSLPTLASLQSAAIRRKDRDDAQKLWLCFNEQRVK